MKEALLELGISPMEVHSVWWISMRQENGERHYYGLLGDLQEQMGALERAICEHRFEFRVRCGNLGDRTSEIPYMRYNHISCNQFDSCHLNEKMC
jgi:hypothetical protein